MRRDRSADEIMNDARALAEQGAAEIGVVGQDTAAWSGDPGGLPGLLSRLAGAYPEIWFRPYYIHPSHYSRNLLDVMTRHHNVMPYLDLPVQHVSGRILRRMGRNYDEAFLREMFAQLEDRELSLSVRVTVIAGYPSETEEDFSRLEKFLGDYKCIRTIAAFPYWPEEGTREYRRTLKEELPSAAVVQSRLSRIGDAADTHNMQWAEELEGREMEVLADTEETGHTVLDAPFVDGACIFDRRVVPGLRYSCILSGGTGPDLEASVKDSGSGG